jgi:hypothetical protein
MTDRRPSLPSAPRGGHGLRIAVITISLVACVVVWDLIARRDGARASTSWPVTATPIPRVRSVPSPIPWPTLGPLPQLPPIPTLAPMPTPAAADSTVPGAGLAVLSVAPLPALPAMPTLAPLPELPAPPPPPAPSSGGGGGSRDGGGGGSSRSGGS